MNATITLREYLEKEKTFVIPNYQRGYVWGKNRDGGKINSVENLIDDLIIRFINKTDVFLQGFTVTETLNEIVLIDGQQRTTCLYLLLKWLGYQGRFEIKYEVRHASNVFLRNLNLIDVDENFGEEYQDIFFFKKTIRIINDKLKDFDKNDFLNYILNKVKFLYINVDAEQATRVFTMMNGSRAEMQQEEIIKAEILRLASLNNDFQNNNTQEWENNMLRSRYAREWDKWLHWWNDERVQSLYCCNNIMGLLVSSYLHLKKGDKLTFESFKVAYLNEESPQEAKQTFDGLRRLQKRFEDAYNNPVTHNMIGAILCIFDVDNQKKFIQYYFVDDKRDSLETYYKLVFLGMTHDEIVERNKNKFVERYDITFNAINDDYVYLNEENGKKEIAFRFLLRLNVDQDTLQGRRFNFNIWKDNNRSLEHIMPKSLVGHQVNGKWFDGNDKEHAIDDFSLKREEIYTEDFKGKTSEHSIGNLVLLYKDENSAFNKSDFAKKKELFFSPQKNQLFKSRHLLHTVCVFAEKVIWDGTSIANNKISTIKKFEEDYYILKREFEYEKQD